MPGEASGLCEFPLVGFGAILYHDFPAEKTAKETDHVH